MTLKILIFIPPIQCNNNPTKHAPYLICQYASFIILVMAKKSLEAAKVGQRLHFGEDMYIQD